MVFQVPQNIIQEKFDFELMKRGRNGCVTFIVIAIALMYFKWIPNVEQMVVSVPVICLGVIAVNLWRIWAMAKVIKHGVVSEKKLINKVKIASLISPILFGTLFAQVMKLDQFSSVTSFIACLITVGMGVGAVLSLSPAFFVAMAFQVLLLTPIIAVAFEVMGAKANDQAVLLASCIVLFLLFNITQIRMMRKLLLESINSFYWLEKSKMDLEESERKLKEESVKVIQQSRLASLGEMAGGVAHEINNPLAVISISHEIISKILKKEEHSVDPGVWNKLDKIQNATQRIKKIVMGLKSFSQQGDQLPSEVATVGQVLNETLEFCNERMKTEGIEFSVTGNLEANIQVRPVQISQIILNLINNSIDEVKGKDQSKILVAVIALEHQVRIDVTDSGLGVPVHIREKLFNPFVTSKEIGKGTGLGLSVSRGLARAHGGDLEYVESEKNTTFRLTLPKVVGDLPQKEKSNKAVA